MDSTKSGSAVGLQTIADIILAPKAALERLRTAPTWGLALIITLVVYMIASYLMLPATIHAVQAGWPAMIASDPRLQALTPAQQQNALNLWVSVAHFSWIAFVVFVPLAILVATVVMLIFNGIGRGSATFATLWAAATNISVPSYALSAVVLAAIVLLRGSDSFSSITAFAAALPSLAWLAPSAGAKVSAFLGVFNIFQIWGAVLIYFAMRFTARVEATPAVLAAIIMPLIAGLWAMYGAR